MDIDLGIEIKVFYDKSKRLGLVFQVSAPSSSNFNLNLHDGSCTFSPCESQILDMSTVQEGESFTLKIYRKDGKLKIDLEGEKKVEVDINSEKNTELGCPAFWGREEMWKVSFPEKSRGVATHYKVGGDDEGGNEEKETDTEGKRSKILLMNLVICKISKWDLGDGFKYSRGQKLRFMPNFLFSY